MTLSREQLILEELKTRLNGPALGPVAKPAGLGFDRSRLRSVASNTPLWGSIYPLEAGFERKGSTSEEKFVVKIVLDAKGSASEPIDQTLDPCWLWTHQQIMADESLGGLCLRIEPVQKIWGFNLAQAPFGDLDLHYLITYRHQAADPTRP